MVFLKNSFSRRYSNLKFEKFDSAQANTANKLTKNVGLYCNSSRIFFKIFSFFIQSKERPAKTKLFPAKLRAVLDTFGSAVNFNC